MLLLLLFNYMSESTEAFIIIFFLNRFRFSACDSDIKGRLVFLQWMNYMHCRFYVTSFAGVKTLLSISQLILQSILTKL